MCLCVCQQKEQRASAVIDNKKISGIARDTDKLNMKIRMQQYADGREASESNAVSRLIHTHD